MTEESVKLDEKNRAAENFLKTIADVRERVDTLLASLQKSLAALKDSNTFYNLSVTAQMVASAQNLVDSWEGSAIRWKNDLAVVAAIAQAAATAGKPIPSETQDKFQHLLDVAAVLARTGVESATMVKDYASESAFKSWFTNLIPGMKASFDALIEALRYLVNAGGKVVGDLTWEAIKPFVLAGGAVALVAFVLVKSGVKLNVGPFKLG